MTKQNKPQTFIVLKRLSLTLPKGNSHTIQILQVGEETTLSHLSTEDINKLVAQKAVKLKEDTAPSSPSKTQGGKS